VFPSLVFNTHSDPLKISSPSSGQAASRNGGNYDPVPYRYVGYPKVARNASEMDTSIATTASTNPISERLLLPRYLCFLRDPGEPALIMNVDEWTAQHGAGRDLSYVFVAYTAEQFRSIEDLRTLHQMADAAARNAGVAAYWVGCSCMPDPNELQEDVSIPISPSDRIFRMEMRSARSLRRRGIFG
jgi:hypothetical protein